MDYSRVYDTSDPDLVVKQICNANGCTTNIGLTFEALELNIAAGKIAHKLSLGEEFDHWRLTAPKIHAAVVQDEMVHNKQLHPVANDEPPENEHLFIVMDKLPLLPDDSVQSEIYTDTFPPAERIVSALSVALRVEVEDIHDICLEGSKALRNMGVVRIPGPNAEPGIIGVYDLLPTTFDRGIKPDLWS